MSQNECFEDLVVLQLTENTLKNVVMFFKHIKDDTIRHVKENGKLEHEYVFEKGYNVDVYWYIEGGNYKNKMSGKNYFIFFINGYN